MDGRAKPDHDNLRPVTFTAGPGLSFTGQFTVEGIPAMRRCQNALPTVLAMILAALLLSAASVAQRSSELQELDRAVFELMRANKRPDAARAAQQAIEKAEQEFTPADNELPWRLDILGFTLRRQRLF